MKYLFLATSVAVALCALPREAPAETPVYFGSFQREAQPGCARLAGHPPGRAECRVVRTGGALMPRQAYSVNLAGFHGTVHYTSEEQGLRIVATLVQDESQAPIRMISVLSPAQSVVISVPRKLGENAAEVEIRRQGDFLVIRQMSPEDAPPTGRPSVAVHDEAD